MQLRPRLKARDIIVEADKTKIIQVVCNLLNNAIKFTKNGDEITISVEEEGGGRGYVIISIKDTGMGIDPDTFSKSVLATDCDIIIKS